MRAEVTHHAVEQYHRRYRPDLTCAEAGAELRILVVTAMPTNAKSLKGDPIWTNGDVRMVVKRDATRRIPFFVVVTVLPPENAEPADEHFEPEPAAIPKRNHALEFDLAKAERELRTREAELVDAHNRLARAQAHLAETKTALDESRGRLKKLQENHHG